MIRRPPRSTLSSSSAASDVYKRQEYGGLDDSTAMAVLRNLMARSILVLLVVLVIGSSAEDTFQESHQVVPESDSDPMPSVALPDAPVGLVQLLDQMESYKTSDEQVTAVTDEVKKAVDIAIANALAAQSNASSKTTTTSNKNAAHRSAPLCMASALAVVAGWWLSL
eukprot:TRINITY_DN12748_c0_g1_i1.p1 TRINITY_DN12748_c0_g1~~TRINITY_DN12748_c0_g1_i1.p1  ORF type:complete len:167 (+),score=38.77 TRINITY_DN12748_c0_g1_i1:103-603(+)